MNSLAIIIPYYNIAFFEKCIQSVAQQSDKSYHLYIGNDKSPDDPSTIVNKYKDQLNYTYLNFPENLGHKNLTLHWNRILEKIQEPWFMILGDDDMLDMNFVKNFNRYLTINPDIYNYPVLKASHCIIDEHDNITDAYTVFDPQINIWDLLYQKFGLGSIRTSLSEYIFKASSFSKFEDFPLAWCADDWAVVFHSYEKGKLLFLKDVKVKVRMSGKNISSQMDNMQTKFYAEFRFFEMLVQKFARIMPTKCLQLFVKKIDHYATRDNFKPSIKLIYYSFKSKLYSKGVKYLLKKLKFI